MKVCVIGAGAMGGTYGGRLSSAGVDVRFVDIWADHVTAINARGLRLTGVPGDLLITAPADLPGARLPDDHDLALITVDSNNTGKAAEIARRALRPEGFALTIQNGIGNLEALTAVLGDDRVIVGSTMCSAIPIGPGHIEQTHEGKTTLGEIGGASSPRLTELRQALERADFQVEETSDILAVIWNKFTLNVAINAICAVAGLRLGELARLPDVDAFQDRILDEVLAVLEAEGVTLPDPDIRRTVKDHCWSKFSKPSMLQHIEAGKTTEIDALNGAVVRLGRHHRIPTPYNASLTALIKGRQFAATRAKAEPGLDYDLLEAQAGPKPA